MSSTLLERPTYLLRRRALGSEAAYRVLSDDDGLATVEVLRAPGLQPGMRVRLMADAVRAMELCDEPIRMTRRFAPLDRAAVAARRAAIHAS